MSELYTNYIFDPQLIINQSTNQSTNWWGQTPRGNSVFWLYINSNILDRGTYHDEIVVFLTHRWFVICIGAKGFDFLLQEML